MVTCNVVSVEEQGGEFGVRGEVGGMVRCRGEEKVERRED